MSRITENDSTSTSYLVVETTPSSPARKSVSGNAVGSVKFNSTRTPRPNGHYFETTGPKHTEDLENVRPAGHGAYDKGCDDDGIEELRLGTKQPSDLLGDTTRHTGDRPTTPIAFGNLDKIEPNIPEESPSKAQKARKLIQPGEWRPKFPPGGRPGDRTTRWSEIEIDGKQLRTFEAQGGLLFSRSSRFSLNAVQLANVLGKSMRRSSETRRNDDRTSGYLSSIMDKDGGRKWDPDGKPNPATLTGRELWTEYRVVDPKWNYKVRWDLGMIVVLIAIAYITPFEVAFLAPDYNLIFYFNRFVDVGFFIDIFLNFHLGYLHPSTKLMIYDKPLIVKRYLRSWFLVDVIAIIPFDLAHIVIGGIIMKRLRVLRLVRLARLARVWKIIVSRGGGQGAKSEHKVDYNMLKLSMLIGMLVLISHWGACVWRLVPSLEDNAVNWVTTTVSNRGYELEDTDGTLSSFIAVWDLYTVSLYWSVMTVTTIGYGDILPKTQAEHVYVIIMMLVGALVFGYVIGQLGNVVTQRNSKTNAYYASMSQLDHFMEEQKLPKELQKEITLYVMRLKQVTDMRAHSNYLRLMSPGLRGKVLVYTNRMWLMKVPHFQNTPVEFQIEVASILKATLYVPNEVLIQFGSKAADMFIVLKGIAAGKNRLFTVGHLIGIEALLHTGGPRLYSCHAITYLHCSSLAQENLQVILDKFPSVKHSFRLLGLRAIFREEVIAYCIAMRTLDLKRIKEERSNLISDDDHIALEQARVSDLFSKSERSEHYYWKLCLLYPVSEKERRAIMTAVLAMQLWVRKRQLRRQANAALLKRSNSYLGQKVRTSSVVMGAASGRFSSSMIERTQMKQASKVAAVPKIEMPLPSPRELDPMQAKANSAVTLGGRQRISIRSVQRINSQNW
eukprot:CAMPEP_0198207028 /NCGR_PEP_ID=MMETSP1445-20131203/10522_1 /TAXON_ID=36898 /ORGANISM="Pyramimonas sp., Strain CCMP2087" /LENGTH=895 /DNA_ID=CAMNT_0043879923 /DNA_START=635 /DNA_END=3319 /DNA_ORIENTATION=+